MAVVEHFLPEAALAEELAVTAALVQRSTVQVRSRGRGAGSGVIWNPDGLIVTNAHVVRGPAATVELADGRAFEAEVTSHDPPRDLAALRVRAADLPAATIADSDVLRVGQLVAAVGNPLGLSGALTLGIIHAIAPSPGQGRQAWVQADVRLAPGNSGGPLADAQGRVIGINSMIAGGLALAVPSNAVRVFLGDRGQRARLGVSLQPVVIPRGSEHLPGLLVLEVTSGSPAEASGLIVGDILIGVGGKTPSGDAGPTQYAPTGAGDLLNALDHTAPGTTVRLELLRGGLPIARDVALQPVVGSEQLEGDTGAAA